jgi:hypothetical protein
VSSKTLAPNYTSGKQKIESATQPPLENGLAKFGENLTMQTNIYVDAEKGFLEKKVLAKTTILYSK